MYSSDLIPESLNSSIPEFQNPSIDCSYVFSISLKSAIRNLQSAIESLNALIFYQHINLKYHKIHKYSVFNVSKLAWKWGKGAKPQSSRLLCVLLNKNKYYSAKKNERHP